MIQIKEFNVKINKKDIVKDLNLNINENEITIIMGPNGSGKSSLLNGLFNHPLYKRKGEILLNGKKLENISENDIVLIPQHPVELEGIAVRQLAWNLAKNKMSAKEFSDMINDLSSQLKLSKELINRSLSGFSGGERKRIELLLALISKPKFVFIDEIDSGLDVDTIKMVANVLNNVKTEGTGIAIITHYPTLLNLLHADAMHIMNKGKVIYSTRDVKGTVDAIAKQGYENFFKRNSQ